MPREIPIHLYRRIGGAAGSPGALLEGEPGYNNNGANGNANGDLFIGDGTAVRTLVSANRQVELTGAQTITGNKTIDVSHFFLTGAGSTDGEILTLADAGTGEVEWTSAPAGGLLTVSANAPLTGNGTSLTPLGLTVATFGTATDQVNIGTNNVYPITSQSLRYLTGDVATLNAALTATNLTAAINEVYGQVAALSSAIQWVGTYDGTTLTAVAPATTGALPAPAAGNRGWTVIMTAAVAVGTAPMPPGPLEIGDWLISPGTGTTWIHIPLHHPATAAANVTITTIGTETWTNVQQALGGLHTQIAAALTTIHVDGTSITGLTSSVGAGLTAANALKVGTIDGGTF